jgi:hypothetical protein
MFILKKCECVLSLLIRKDEVTTEVEISVTPSRWLPAVKESASCAGGEWLLCAATGGNPVVVGGGLLVHIFIF